MTNPKETKISKTQPRGEVSTRTEVISEDPLGTENAERVATLPEVPRGTTRYKLYVRRFFRNKLATVGVVILGFLIFAAFFGNFFASGTIRNRTSSLCLSHLAPSTGLVPTIPAMTFMPKPSTVLAGP